jgi:GNAT superfamily N-acetyltransferase
MATIHTTPATRERWDDIVTVFGRRGNDPGWCWCQRFMDPPLDGGTLTNNRDALHDEIESVLLPPGVLAYVDGTPAGWARVKPRTAVPLFQRNRALRRILGDDPGVWWITCFAVDQRHRSLGVATALLEAAVAHAASHGATALEGHPVDTGALKAERVSGSALFTGTMRTFVACGFHEIGRTYVARRGTRARAASRGPRRAARSCRRDAILRQGRHGLHRSWTYPVGWAVR